VNANPGSQEDELDAALDQPAGGFDVAVIGGTVIDPANGVHARLDVGIADNRIAAVGPNLGGKARRVIDASGSYVIPGLVDLHVHVYWGVADLAVEADPTCLGRGATTVVDAGSSGANTFAGFRRYIVEPAQGRILHSSTSAPWARSTRSGASCTTCATSSPNAPPWSPGPTRT
jgi:hypothetical protein